MSIFGKARKLVAWNRLGIRLGKLESALKKESMSNGLYDPRVTAVKCAKGIGEGALAVVLPALVAYLTDSAALTAALTKYEVSDGVIVLLVPIIVGLVRAANNRLKHLA